MNAINNVISANPSKKISLVFQNVTGGTTWSALGAPASETGYGSIVSISLPNTVTAIGGDAASSGSNAFSSFKNLKKFSANYVKTIGKYAFYQCTALETIVLPAATSIGDDAFSGCTKLTAINQPEVTILGNRAFGQCSGIVTVRLPKLTTIGQFSFVYCTALTDVYFGSTVPTLPENMMLFSNTRTGVGSDLITIHAPSLTGYSGVPWDEIKAGTGIAAGDTAPLYWGMQHKAIKLVSP